MIHVLSQSSNYLSLSGRIASITFCVLKKLLILKGIIQLELEISRLESYNSAICQVLNLQEDFNRTDHIIS